ncbi:MAG: NUDIX domain-containing protein [Alphaproteobacteria bacterium]
MEQSYKPIHFISRAVIIDQDHLLVTYHPPSEHIYTNLPGGHVEWSEGAETAIKRELLEETGLVFQKTQFLGVLEYSFERSGGCHTHECNFVFWAESAEVKYPFIPTSPEQNCAFKWVALGDLEGTNLMPEPLRTLIPLWVNNPHKPRLDSSLQGIL